MKRRCAAAEHCQLQLLKLDTPAEALSAMWYSGRATAAGGGPDSGEQPPLRRRNTGTKQSAGVVLDSLLHFRPTHTSVEDNMREALHMLDILPPDQRKVRTVA